MLNIHSFLHRIRERLKDSRFGKYQSCIMVSAYVITAAAILVLSSERLYNATGNLSVVYAKTDQVTDVFAEAEETANEAKIRTEEKKVKELQGIKERIVQQEKQKKQLEQKRKIKESKKIEQKRKKLPAAKQSKSTGRELSGEEANVLKRIVEAEATGEDIKGRILVANVILNRVKSSKFPNTVKEVVFQRKGSTVQFSPTKDGRYWSVNVSAKTKEAVKRALAGEDYSRGALYFSARSRADKHNMRWFDGSLKWLFKYGGHEFYKDY